MSTGAYAAAYEQSISDPDAFWSKAAEAIEWATPPATILDDSRPPFYRWFTGGRLNTCFNVLDRHVRDGRGEQAALIYDSPVTGAKKTYTYAALLDEVARFAGGLSDLGVEQGDRVLDRARDRWRLAVGHLAHRLAQDLARPRLRQPADDVDLAQARHRTDLVADPLHELSSDPRALGIGIDAGLEHDQPARDLALEVVGHADDRTLGDIGAVSYTHLTLPTSDLV